MAINRNMVTGQGQGAQECKCERQREREAGGGGGGERVREKYRENPFHHFNAKIAPLTEFLEAQRQINYLRQ